MRFTSVILLTKMNAPSCFIADGNELKNGDNIAHGMTLRHTIQRAGLGMTIDHSNEFVQSHFSDGFLMKYLNMIINYKIR